MEGENTSNQDGLLKDSYPKPKQSEGWGKRFRKWVDEKTQIGDRINYGTSERKKALKEAEADPYEK